MGHLQIVDRRREGRAASNVSLLVWGIDTRGERFAQQVQACDISLSGALLSGLDGDLRSGDVIGVLYGSKRARFRVVWIRREGVEQKMQAAVQRLEGDACPWQELLPETAPSIAQT
ncbi:MAG TPA: hypothetical protein VKV39_13805 [Candidatus Sulfotelmatobacter sp.]|nr:hypothetical protein [Candidatus Sulfotelmatobacter sp.]